MLPAEKNPLVLLQELQEVGNLVFLVFYQINLLHSLFVCWLLLSMISVANSVCFAIGHCASFVSFVSRSASLFGVDNSSKSSFLCFPYENR